MDVTRRLEEIDNWEKLQLRGQDAGPRPEPLELGDKILKTSKPASKSIFWTKGIRVDRDGTRSGQGFFNIEMAFLELL